MSTLQLTSTKKRPVNLTLNEELVTQAKAITPNLSAVVESLLAGYVEQRQHARNAEFERAKSVANVWNSFNEQSGSFADEYSSL